MLLQISMIVNSVKQVCKRGHREVFFTNVPGRHFVLLYAASNVTLAANV